MAYTKEFAEKLQEMMNRENEAEWQSYLRSEKQKSLTEGLFEAALKMYNSGMKIEDISKILELPEEEIENYIKQQ